MQTESLRLITSIFGKMAVYLGRPQIRNQIALFILILFASYFCFGIASRLILRPLARRLYAAKNKTLITRFSRLIVNLVEASIFPLTGLILTQITVVVLKIGGHLSGLLVTFSQIFFVIWLLGLITTIVYINLNQEETQRYRRRFLLPAMFLLVVLHIFGQMVNLREVAQVIIVHLFDSPITVGALFIATIGLYLYTDAVNQLHDFAVNGIVRYSRADEGSVRAVSLLIRYALIIIGFGFALDQLNLNTTTIAAITGGLSVGIGFGLREILSNFIAGILLMFERSLHTGDVIEVDDEISRVEAVNIRSTRVRTLDNVELIIPNQTFLTSQFKTYTGSDSRVRFHVMVVANYENDMRQILSLLQVAALSVPDVLQDPKPRIDVQDSFGDNVVGYRLHVWSSEPMQIPRLKGEVMQAVWMSFQQHGINLTFPDVELHFNDTLGAKWPQPPSITGGAL